MRDYDCSGVTTCNSCGLEKVRKRSEMEPKAKRWVYRDQTGRRWKKRRCPDCEVVARVDRRIAAGWVRKPRVKKERIRKGYRMSPEGQVKCRDCGLEKARNLDDVTTTGNKRFKDENGRRWYRLRCPECTLLYNRKSKGKVARAEVVEYKNRLGFESESVVKRFFESLGFEVTQSNSTGPDLTLLAGDRTMTCEVKTATSHFVDGKPYWFCSPVYPKRRRDDLMAIVFEESVINLETMAEHLAACTQSGRRQLTEMARNFQIKGAL